MSEERQVPAVDQEETDRTGRREALKQMGKYAVYTAPTLTALTVPLDAAVARAKSRPRPKGSGR